MKAVPSNEKESHPTVLTIFGITGDLATRKLLPSLFALHQKQLLPENLYIVGFSRRDLTPEEFRAHVRGVLQKHTADEAAINSFLRRCSYVAGFFDKKEGYATLAAKLGEMDAAWNTCSNKLFYLAVPPLYYEIMFTHLSDSGLTIPCGPDGGWTRVVVEKPFGSDFETAERLDQLLGKLFAEEQIYRIDHYLGKETVQNICAFRSSHSALPSTWNKDSIASITVRFHETLGVETRGGFYDNVGALRDVGQNHILQLLALFLMDQPPSLSADAVRNGRLAVLEALEHMDHDAVGKQTKRGQYEGYTHEKEVGAMSRTETYFHITATMQAGPWEGVRVIVEGGKKMPESMVEVEVVFRQSDQHDTNTLHYRIQPEESIVMKVGEKDLVLDYTHVHEKQSSLDAYEKLILDALAGDQTLFVSTKEILASWKFIDPIVKAWQAEAVPLHIYKQGEGGK